MTGDQDDMRKRLRLTLPGRWFGDVAPILDGVLAGLAQLWSQLYTLLQVVPLQARVHTATDDFLNLAASDFFGGRFDRRGGEGDSDFRARLLWAMQREHGTRASLVDLAAHTGYSLEVFEAARPADTGAYNRPSTLAWGISGRWGSLQMPYECLIRASSQGSPYPSELLAGLAEAMPAGGAAWVKIVG